MRQRLRYDPRDERVLACKKAVARAGGLTEVGRHFGVTPQAIYKWEVVPADRCQELAEISGMTVYELRPDIFGAKPRGRRARAG